MGGIKPLIKEDRVRYQRKRNSGIGALGLLVFVFPLFTDISDSGLERSRRRLKAEYHQPGEVDLSSAGGRVTFPKKDSTPVVKPSTPAKTPDTNRAGDRKMYVDSSSTVDFVDFTLPENSQPILFQGGAGGSDHMFINVAIRLGQVFPGLEEVMYASLFNSFGTQSPTIQP